MKMGLQSGMAMRQQQKMAPYLYQSLNLLTLPLLDMRQKIEEIVEQNPALELEYTPSPFDTQPVYESESDPGEDYFYNSSDPGYISGSSRDGDNKRKYLEGAVATKENLHDHLLHQLAILDIKSGERKIGELLINNLDGDGFHLEPPSSLVSSDDEAGHLLPRVLRAVQALDPVGTCVADWQESLIVQCRLREDAPPRAEEVVSKYIVLLGKEDEETLKRRLKLSESELRRIIDFVHTLDPFPGRRFNYHAAAYITPDLIVERDGDEFSIRLNDSLLPPVRISESLKALIPATKGDERRYIRERIQEARFFMRALDRRQQTLFKAGMILLELQKPFFRYGPARLAPMKMKHMAEQLDVHEATVSRLVAGKYIATDFGPFEFRFFFSTGQEGLSREAIKEIIKQIIAKNQKGRLSDRKICDMLTERGIKIARRTVAKYRGEIKIH